jgi:F-type H+-transporting ATPase subunit alpha
VEILTPTIKAEKIADLISKNIEQYEKTETKIEEIGKVLEAGDGIVRIQGLPRAMIGEVLKFSKGVYGLVLNLDKNEIGAVILDNAAVIQEGDIARCTGRIIEVPVGEELIGRIVDPLGRPLDDKGPIKAKHFRPVEFKAPGVVDRQPIKEPLQTGIKAVDSIIPIGRGQRELIVSDRNIGKTAILADTIINQRGKNVYCIYVAIGQKTLTVTRISKKLEEMGAMDYSTIICASAREPASLQYIAAYAGCAMGEYFMYSGKHALVMFDDLSKHAVAYRQLSLLLRRPPGREAYPGDIFYLHSRLLERAAKLSDDKGGGSLTAIPVVEVKGGDISGYIPTNIISITDGQIYLESDLFNAGIRPAINPGISVSRVGADAQVKAMKKVARLLRLDLAKYRELETFAKFGTELDKDTKKQLARGERIVEVLKQDQFQPMPMEDQVLIIYVLTKGYLDDINVHSIQNFEKRYLHFMHKNYLGIVNQIKKTKDLSEELEEKIRKAILDFKISYSDKFSEK